jgi:aspartate aminotransferase
MSSHWSAIPLAPPDKILGLTEQFKEDPNPRKVSLGVGAYRDNHNKPHVLPTVREAEERVFNKRCDHEYAGISGVQGYVDASILFAYGDDATVIKEGRVAAVQTLSGTGACRLVGDFVKRFHGTGTPIYLPSPTWGNHHNIFKDAGLEVKTYSYYDATTCSMDFVGLTKDVQDAPDGSVFLLHACAHNPTGCDPSAAQWDALSTVMKAKEHVVFFDCAYQGFASGDSETDAYSIRKFVEDGHNILLSQSFAKNFGLYGERVGTLSVVCDDAEEVERVLSQLKALIRPMYSSPVSGPPTQLSFYLHTHPSNTLHHCPLTG